MTIVAGKIGYVEGSATVNGSGRYSFLLTVIDNGEPGRSDRFGLQVKDSHGTPVASLTFSPTTLTGGNLLVGHKWACRADAVGTCELPRIVFPAVCPADDAGHASIQLAHFRVLAG